MVSFLDGLEQQASPETVVRHLLADKSLRELLTYTPTSNMDLSGEPTPWYPSVGSSGDERAFASSYSIAARRIVERCAVPFDRLETIALLDHAFGQLLRESLEEPYTFLNSLDAMASRQRGGYRLNIVLEIGGTNSSQKSVDAEQRLEFNALGRAIAYDAISACHSRLLTTWLVRQMALMKREVCRTILAAVAYFKTFGSFPPDLDVLVARGFGKTTPRSLLRRPIEV